jgi:histidinol dehydrogenase
LVRQEGRDGLRIIDARNQRQLSGLFRRDVRSDRAFERRVHGIVDRVRKGGDHALAGFARRFDGTRGALEVSPDEIRAGAASVAPDVRRAIRQAARHIARVAFRQIPKHWDLSVAPGVSIEQRVEPIARVGCYVPGGRFPLPSSLLMTAVPARVAGVREVIAVCPKPEPAVMAAALEAGVTRLFRIGGAHGVAALAFGTETVPRVDKIVGPGNRYVATAKAYIADTCAIDFYAGPTEIVIVAGEGRPDWIAADLIAQAEHDPDARSILITWSRGLASRVARAVTTAAAGREIATRSLDTHGAIVITRSADEAIALANRLAPEHLVVDREALTRRSLTAGAVFVGPYTAQAAGDYATGSNHVLPTAGAARFRGGLSAADFVRVMNVQRVTRAGLKGLASTVVPLAHAEGLTAHAESIEVRL